MSHKPTLYWEYLKLDELLGLQGGIEGDEGQLTNDEVMFIVIHQIDELWFKLAIRELVSVRDLFKQDPVPEQALASAVRGIRRITLLFQSAISHFSLMESMTTRDYLGFRDKLSPASGFQSAQLREVELILGLGDTERVPLGNESSYMAALKHPDGSETPASRSVAARKEDLPSIRDAVHLWLYRTPIQGSRPGDANDETEVQNFIDAFLGAHAKEVDTMLQGMLKGAADEEDRRRLKGRFAQEMAGARAFLMADGVPDSRRAMTRRIRAALVFIESYRELPLLAWPREVLEAIVGLEQAFLIFRQRHARMVERVIGRRTGTGGSAGVDYLDSTALKYRVFRDVWAVRTLLLREEALPPMPAGEFYGFAAAD